MKKFTIIAIVIAISLVIIAVITHSSLGFNFPDPEEHKSGDYIIYCLDNYDIEVLNRISYVFNMAATNNYQYIDSIVAADRFGDIQSIKLIFKKKGERREDDII